MHSWSEVTHIETITKWHGAGHVLLTHHSLYD
jgi:hypothetical protein